MDRPGRVVPEGNDIFDGASGAYANVLANAASVEDYMAVTTPVLLRHGLIAVGVDDPEPLRERRSRVQLSDETIDLDEQARKRDVVWGTFYVFEGEDEQV
jgi:hypothetical protein